MAEPAADAAARGTLDDALAAAAAHTVPERAVPPLPDELAPAPEVADPAPPRPRSWIEELPAMAWRWLTGGNTVVRVGVVILFFGVPFLLRYAYERIHVAIELGLAGVAIGAIVLLAVGWRLRTSREGYALTLQAAAVGLLYLTVFAAFRLYGVLPPAIRARLDFRVGRPGHIFEVKTDLTQNRAAVQQIDLNAWGIIRILHTFTGVRLQDTMNQRDWILTSVWAFAMDAVALGSIVMVLGSFYMWWIQPQKRRMGLIACSLGMVSCGFFVFGLRWLF